MRVVVALVLALACAGCAHPFPGTVSFQAPPGWVHSNDPTAGDTWIKQGDSNQSIMAQTTNSSLPPHEPGWQNIAICGNHPAQLLFQRKPSGQLWEAISTNWNSHRYMAVYARPVSARPDPAAEKAIRNICLKTN